MKSPFVWFAALLVIASAITVQSFQSPQPASEESAGATYSHGILHVTIPYAAPRSGVGQLTVEVLTPEDQALARTVRPVYAKAGKAAWEEDLQLTKALAIDDLVWHRLRYRFAYHDQKAAAIEGADSISQILRTPVIHIVGQRSFLSGRLAAVRVIATDSKNKLIAGSSSLQIELGVSGQKARVLFTGPLNRRGTADAHFLIPAGLTGGYQLRYVVDTPIGSAEFTQQVRLEDKASILLTSEKPIYQPGQTIHVRALALDRSNHEAVAGRKLTF